MFAMSLMALPCREALLEVVNIWFQSLVAPNRRRRIVQLDIALEIQHIETVQDATITTEDDLEILSITEGQSGEFEEHHHRVLIPHESIQSEYIFRNIFAHYVSTLLIIAT